MTIPKHKITGLILAGGQSRRMGGGDKGLIDLGGKPMMAHVIERLAPQVGRMVINANGDPARFAAFGLPVVADTIGGFVGPLAGVLAGLRWTAANVPDASHVASVSADAPFLPGDLVPRLVRALDTPPLPSTGRGRGWGEAAGVDQSVLGIPPTPYPSPQRGGETETGRRASSSDARSAARQPAKIALAASGGELHPVIGLWPVALADDLEEALESGLRKVLHWTDRHGTVPVEFPFLDFGGRKIDPFFNANTPEELDEARQLLQL